MLTIFDNKPKYFKFSDSLLHENRNQFSFKSKSLRDFNFISGYLI